MMEDDFYATVKLKCGDEIFAKICASDEGDRTLLLVSNPIVVEEVKARGQLTGFKFEPWLKNSNEDLFIINIMFRSLSTLSHSNRHCIIWHIAAYLLLIL